MFDPMLLIPLVLLGVMLIFMWRGNKKRAAQQSELREQMVVGAEVMTQAGIYGTIIEQDQDNNVTTIETTPGVQLRVHPATIVNVVSPTVPDDASALTSDQPEAAADTTAPAADAAEPVAEAKPATEAQGQNETSIDGYRGTAAGRDDVDGAGDDRGTKA